jgi:hypothetical protein
MVEIIRGDRANAPLIHIHYIERTVHGNGIAIKVYGEMLAAAKEYVYARELKLNTIETLNLTPHTGDHHLYHVQKYIYNKGEYDNYASVDIFSATAYEMIATGRGSEISAATVLPEDGSIWLDFIAMGE